MFVSSLMLLFRSSPAVISSSLILFSSSRLGDGSLSFSELLADFGGLLVDDLLIVAGLVVEVVVGIVDVVAGVVVGSLGNWASKSCRYLLMVGVVVAILLEMTGMLELMRRVLSLSNSWICCGISVWSFG